jgi:hypothetical protein
VAGAQVGKYILNIYWGEKKPKKYGFSSRACNKKKYIAITAIYCCFWILHNTAKYCQLLPIIAVIAVFIYSHAINSPHPSSTHTYPSFIIPNIKHFPCIVP